MDGGLLATDQLGARDGHVVGGPHRPAVLGDPAKTRVVSLYKLVDSRPFHECWTVLRDVDRPHYDSIVLDDIGDDALLVFGQKGDTPIEWVEMVHDLTDLDLSYVTREASAILFVRVDGAGFALSFGGGFRLLVPAALDREFGLDFALRAIDSEDVRHVRRQHFNAKARVDSSSIPSGQGLWTYGIREHAELVRQVTGKVASADRLKLSHVRKMAKVRSVRVSIDCSERVRLPLPNSADHLVADLHEVLRILREVEVDADLEPLKWIRRLRDDDDCIEDATAQMVCSLLDYSDDVNIAYPARYHGGPEIARFRGQIGALSIDDTELSLSLFREALEDRDGAESQLQTLKAGRVTGHDDTGTEIGGDESALHWLSASIDLQSGRRLVLLDGDWFDLTEAYVDYVDRIVRNAFADKPSWSLPAWSSAPRNDKGRVEEKLYNQHVAGSDTRFLCLDRKLIRTRMHKRGFEACDLLGPDNELIHVKKVSSTTGSGPLSHLFAQGIVAIEGLTELATWQLFVDLVAEQSPARAETLGTRPHTLVFAIHRSDGALSPERLFAFAKSELASASIVFSRLGVALKVSVIP